ncbi:Holliday junction branch migration protein RuvA [Acidocella sp.]|uniref:Holliday junction branch migration protein RuvA n=1 Tax=Acidocella sp. TaxID=50710 RepID=UPI00261E5E37|nr:Holliday junction branch migration protein RuvA [Acidocella sp.]
MIAHLRGLIDSVQDSSCVIDVNGVGYLVFCSSRTLGALDAGAAANLLTEMQVREDAITLYGFSSTAEKEWFRLLTTVQGVGAKVALAILSALSPDQLIAAISSQDRAALSRAPGVGPKLAVRLVTELREKAGVMPGGGAAPLPAGPKRPHHADALSALLNLGYRHAEAQTALAHAVEQHGEDAALDMLIRGALKALSR